MAKKRKSRAKRVELEIPFPGFYHSILSDALDSELESFAENEQERERYGDDAKPPELRLPESAFADAWEFVDYRKAETYLAREWVASFNVICENEYDLDLDLSFVEMTSPREYNFTTDRVFCSIGIRKLQKLFRLSKEDKHQTLAQVIRERFTSYDGFISFYRNELDSWLAKPLRDWDENERGTLLRAVLRLNGAQTIRESRDYYESLESRIYEHMSDSGDFCTAFDLAMDWSKWEDSIAEKRADLEAELSKDDPDYVPPTPRCPFTLDMFRDE